MRKELGFILIISLSLIISILSSSRAQENQTIEPETIEPEAVPPEEVSVPVEVTLAPEEPQTLWLWGEVVSTDPQNKTLVVEYLDYDTDTEKEISISVDDKTTYENAASLEEIKPQSTVSIDYIASPEGKYVAKNVGLEKPEGIETTP